MIRNFVASKKFVQSGLRPLLLLAALVGLGLALPARAMLPEVISVMVDDALVQEGASAAYRAGDAFLITVVFDRPVTVTSSPGNRPQLNLSMAPQTRPAEFYYALGTSILFMYQVRPGDFTARLRYPSRNSLFVPLGAQIACAQTGNEWPPVYLSAFDVGGLPPPGAPQALDQTSDVSISTMRLFGPSSVNDGQSVDLTVSRGASMAGESLLVTMIYPPEISGPGSVTIPAGATSVEFPVTGRLPTTAPVTVKARGPNYPADGSGDVTHDMNVIGIPPYLEITGGLTQLSEGAGGQFDTATTWTVRRRGSGSVSGSLTVDLSFIDNSPDTAVISLSQDSVTIPNGSDFAEFSVQARDGDFQAQVIADATGYDAVGRTVFVENVNPTITGGSLSPGTATIGENITARFTATDVPADRPGLRGRWSWGDGSPDTTNVPSGESVQHAYDEPGIYTVSLTVSDKDGGVATRDFEVVVTPGFRLTVDIPGPGADGLANIGSGNLSFVPAPSVVEVETANTVSVRFRETQTSILMTATPDQPDSDGYQNYVYRITGEGIAEGAQQPLAHGAGSSSATVQVVLGLDRTATVWFSREWTSGDGRGDIDGDGLTDEWELRWSLDPTSVEEPFGAGRGPSEDRMPYGAPEDPVLGGPFGYPIPYSSGWRGYAPLGQYFSNILQFRGQDMIIGTDDDPGTNPNTADTTGDGLTDGWLYYFWANAINNPDFVGRAYDPHTITGSLEIANADLRFYFNPRHARVAGMDLDGDGLIVIEEYYLGTNPIDWDTDGDGMPDGWEVLYGLDPLDPGDRNQNPDQDYMAYYLDPATGEEYLHHDVYELFDFDPRTAWAPRVFYPDLSWRQAAPNTRPYRNIDEYLVMLWHLERTPGLDIIPASEWLTWSTDPLSPDTDADGMPDGWELYLDLNPNDENDGEDVYASGLTGAEEFSCRGAEILYSEDVMAGIIAFAGSRRENHVPVWDYLPEEFREDRMRSSLPLSEDHFAMLDPDWLNKFWPTDPHQIDTSGDQISDGASAAYFRYDIEGITGTPVRNHRGEIVCYAGGGLNPTSVDTDGDGLPDFWEVSFAGSGQGGGPVPDGEGNWLRDGMDGTWQDAHDDYDNDGLLNYQEYLVGAMHHFNYDKWEKGLGYGGYDAIEFFLPEEEFGPGHYGAAPHEWDLAYWWDPEGVYAPGDPIGGRFFFQLAEMRWDEDQQGYRLAYATTDPREWSTDSSGMCDYYQLFHGLNPLWSIDKDLVGKPAALDAWFDLDFDRQNAKTWAPYRDAREFPWMVGDEMADPDMDGLPNWEEAIHPNRPYPQPYHTDPTPYWFTDMSYDESFVNLYYQLGSLPFYWGDMVNPPSYMFTFASNEGYDTDNDSIPDRQELTGGDSPGKTDPLDFNEPLRRNALYLDGNAAARTRAGFFHGTDALRTFTVEMWIKPLQTVTGVRQVIIERPVNYGHVRRNFRLGITEDGLLFVEFNNSGEELLTVEAEAASGLIEDNTWIHVAGVYDGEALKLYANGNLQGVNPRVVIPATGVIYSDPDKFANAPIVIGAADGNPDGMVLGGNRYYNNEILDPVAQPALDKFFRGWVDEVRVWDGARTVMQINETMFTRMRQPEVAANEALREENPGVPLLLYHFNFNGLPDPNYEGIVPDGFDSLNNRPAGYTGVPWWEMATDTSTVYYNHAYVPWIQNMVAHRPLDPPMDSRYWGTTSTGGALATNEFPNTANPYGHGYLHAASARAERNPELTPPSRVITKGFNPAEDRLYNNLLPLRNARADRDVDLWDGYGPGINPEFDFSGDGLPDLWKLMNAFDPYRTDGIHGAWGDPDRDGLPNWAEYLAGTDPNNFDTSDDGFSDYDSRPHPASPTFGQIYDDWDGMPGLWEIQHGLDHHRYDGHRDEDSDGWSNYAEFMAGTRPDDPGDFPRPLFRFNLDSERTPSTADVLVHVFSTPTMDGEPDAVFILPGITQYPYTYVATNAASGHVREGDAWFFAFQDLDDSGSWRPGEPAAIAEYQPVNISWGTVEVSLPLREQAFGFPRFAWNTVGAGPAEVTVEFFGNTLFSKVMEGPRNYLHEGDLIHMPENSPFADYRYGLGFDTPSPTYNWTVTDANGAVQSGSFTVHWGDPVGRTEPWADTSYGDAYRSLVFFRWTMDERNTAVRFELHSGSSPGQVVMDQMFALPRRRRGTGSSYYYELLPQYGGRGMIELPDGEYVWRVTTHNPGTSAMNDYAVSSDWANLIIDRTSAPAEPYSISGKLSYFGPVDHPVKVQAFRRDQPHVGPDGFVREGFAGRPYAQTTVAGPHSEYVLEGLPEGTYFIRAFMDQTGSGVPEIWETRGFLFDEGIEDPWPFRSLKAVSVGPGQLRNNIILRDRDTDNDKLPDAWEYEQVGNLHQLGSHNTSTPVWQPTASGGYTSLAAPDGDANQDGLPDVINMWLGTLAMEMDSDGDGISDLEEFFSGSNPLSGEGRPFVIPSLRLDENRRPVIGWDVPLDNAHLALSQGYILVYEIQWMECAMQGGWETVGDVQVRQLPEDCRMEWTHQENDGGGGFYRLKGRLMEKVY